MTRGRIFTFLAILALSTGVLTVFMTSRAAGDKPADPKPVADRILVCWGDIDTEDRFVGLFPENFPMPARVTLLASGRLAAYHATPASAPPATSMSTTVLNGKSAAFSMPKAAPVL